MVRVARFPGKRAAAMLGCCHAVVCRDEGVGIGFGASCARTLVTNNLIAMYFLELLLKNTEFFLLNRLNFTTKHQMFS